MMWLPPRLGRTWRLGALERAFEVMPTASAVRRRSLGLKRLDYRVYDAMRHTFELGRLGTSLRVVARTCQGALLTLLGGRRGVGAGQEILVGLQVDRVRDAGLVGTLAGLSDGLSVLTLLGGYPGFRLRLFGVTGSAWASEAPWNRMALLYALRAAAWETDRQTRAELASRTVELLAQRGDSLPPEGRAFVAIYLSFMGMVARETRDDTLFAIGLAGLALLASDPHPEIERFARKEVAAGAMPWVRGARGGS